MIDQIILVAEKIDSSLNLSIDSFDFEKTDTKYFNQVMGSLENIAEKVIHIEDISDLYQYKDSNSIVISLWSGESTKFRKALVPSICESLNIKYLGADPYSSIICQDKNLSKLFARKYGIKSSNGFIVNNIQGLECIPSIQFPVVVKPNFEGGSIGINENIRTLMAAGLTISCWELDQFPEKHASVIASKFH